MRADARRDDPRVVRDLRAVHDARRVVRRRGGGADPDGALVRRPSAVVAARRLSRDVLLARHGGAPGRRCVPRVSPCGAPVRAGFSRRTRSRTLAARGHHAHRRGAVDSLAKDVLA